MIPATVTNWGAFGVVVGGVALLLSAASLYYAKKSAAAAEQSADSSGRSAAAAVDQAEAAKRQAEIAAQQFHDLRRPVIRLRVSLSGNDTAEMNPEHALLWVKLADGPTLDSVTVELVKQPQDDSRETRLSLSSPAALRRQPVHLRPVTSTRSPLP